jgi:predicted Ser/Thr protein kinase
VLVPADIMAAKLLVQMGDITVDQARQHLRATSADPNTQYDFVNRLAWELLVDPQQYQRIRDYVARFEFLRSEAMFLSELESRGRAKGKVYDLITRIEREAYRYRLGDLLVDLGQLTPAEQREIEQAALQKIRLNDAMMVNHYSVNDFKGVSAPLIRRSRITPEVFRLPVLFRSDQTLKMIDMKLHLQRQSQVEMVAARPPAGQDPFMEDTVTAELVEPVPAERTRKIDRARLDDPDRITESKILKPIARIGPYEVLEQLGEGCFGAVYLGRKTARSAIVALKLLTGEEDDEERARFLREAQLMARFDHPHVVGLIDQGKTQSGKDFIALPAITGESLREMYRKQKTFGGFEPARALRYFEQLLEGLQHIHDQQVVHRDVKPENILVMLGTDEVKVVDFGIARPVDTDAADIFRTACGSISGSPAYIAPETICGSPIDGRTDLYSAGIVLFEMLTGQKPLRAASPYAFLKEHMVAVPHTLARAKPDYDWPPELERLVARLLAKTPEERPDSAQAVLDELRGGLNMKILQRTARPKDAQQPDGKATGVLNRFFHRS